MEHISVLVVAVIITALVFDFTNGFHDTANSMATSISTGALKPKVAVGISAVLNLVGAFLSVEVAKTISGGILDESTGLHPSIIFAGLIGAILWNLVTWLYGIPSSSSHALFGGLIGATIVGIGSKGVHFDIVLKKIVLPALAAPLVAGLAAAGATWLAYRITRNTRESTSRRGFKAGQIASASLVSLAHGTNDAQKTMGVITLTLVAVGALPGDANPPLWVIISAGLAIAAGTWCGGWRIIRTMGKGITDIAPPQGFSAQAGAATVILASSHLGMALSTTHVCSGGVIGAGVGKDVRSVRWGVARKMAISWVLTLPASGLVGGAAAYVAGQGDVGVAGVAVVALVAAGWIWNASRRNRVDAGNVNDGPAVDKEAEGAGAGAAASVAAAAAAASPVTADQPRPVPAA
jgi:PiT family inorganic phosphate transporter